MTWSRLSDTLVGIPLKTPVIIASGVWPYDADLWDKNNLDGVGAICTKAVKCFSV